MFRSSRNTSGRLWKATFAAGMLTLASITLAQQPGTGTGPNPGTTPSDQPSAAPLTSQRVIYEATFIPANTSVTSAVNGTVRFVEDGDRLGVVLEAFGLAPDMMHEQHIHAGSQCADLSADTNNDGIIDAVEAQAVSGPPVVPLTLGANGTNSTPAASAGTAAYPIAASDGSVLYVNTFSVSSIMPALSTPMTSPSGSPTSTSSPGASPTSTSSPESTASPSPGTTTGIGLENHVVEIHGVAADTNLPSTVQSVEGLPATQTLPVACAVIRRVGTQ